MGLVRHETRLSPPVKIFLLTVPRRTSFVDRFVSYASCWCVVLSCLFLIALWSPSGKGLTSWLSCLLRFVAFPNVSWSTWELRMRLRPWNWFKPSSKIVLLTVPRWYFFCGSFVLFMSCVCHAFASVHCRLVVTCWERTDLLALVCDV